MGRHRARGVIALKHQIRIDGEPVEPAAAEIVESEPGVWSVLSGGVSWEARLAGNEITIDGRRFTFEIDDPRQWKRSSRAAEGHGRATITAAMPGKIVRIVVSVGDEVIAGQGVLVIEAMKMQNELKAPRDGRVTSIEVKEHDSVNAGAKLLTIE
jgi:biotin carboxyl carrier protein